MTEVIAITSQKGGCGKTTTALNLALSLAEGGHSTLLVDVDPQGAIGHALRQQERAHVGLAEVLTGQLDIKDAIIQTKHPRMGLLGRGRLDPADTCEFELELFTEGHLRDLLKKVSPAYEYVVIDTPSGLGMSTRAALDASDSVLVPLQAEPLALRSVEQVLRVIEKTQQTSNPSLSLLGILPTMVSRHEDHSMNVLIASWKNLGGIFETTIPREEVFGRASEAGVPLAYLGGKLPAEAKRFDLLAGEVIARVDERKGTEGKGHERPEQRLL